MQEDGKVPYAMFVGKTKIAVRAENLHRRVHTHLTQALRETVEGKYTQGSYVRNHSATILRRTPLVQEQGNPRGVYVTTVEYVADRIALHPGDRILCRIESLNKVSALARAGDFLEVRIYLARDQHNNAAFFEQPEMGVGASAWIQVMPSPEGAMNDAYVVVYGKILHLEGSSVLQTPELLPAPVRRKAPEMGDRPAKSPALGEMAPSMSVVRMVSEAPSWDSVLQGMLKRGPSEGDLELARRLTTPFRGSIPFADRRFWWELVQRTALMQEEMPLTALIVGSDEPAETARTFVDTTLQTLLAPSIRLPGQVRTTTVEPSLSIGAGALYTAAIVLDPSIPNEENKTPTLATLLQTEPAVVGRMLTAMGSLEPNGTLAAVLTHRSTRMMADWMAWIARNFREVTWIKPAAMDPLFPTVVVVMDGFHEVSTKVREEMVEVWGSWERAVRDGQFVADLEPSPATAAFVESWTNFLDRIQRHQVRSVRDALRVLEDEPDAEEQHELREKVHAAVQQWAESFRFPSEVPETHA